MVFEYLSIKLIMKPKQILLISLVFLGIPNAFSQGLVNNGARIVMTNTANIYIAGNSNGNYKNQSGGLITSSTAGGTITLEGNWTNNASNVAFSNDGVTVKLDGAAQAIEGSNSSTFYHLNLGGTNIKTLAVNTTVGGISTLTGVLSLGARPLDLNSRTLTISNPAGSAVTNSTGSAKPAQQPIRAL